jgi:acyl-CoA reductase-like NAD-dependent aldehyde dehydrogenase
METPRRVVSEARMGGVKGFSHVVGFDACLATRRDLYSPPMLNVEAEKDALRVVKGNFQLVPEDGELGEVIFPLIDGERAGSGIHPALLLDPSNGKPFAQIVYATAEDVDRAAESAARSLALWRGTPFEARGRKLRTLADLIQREGWAIAKLIAQEQGKPCVEAFNLEVLPALDHLKFIINYAERYHAGLKVDPRHPFYAHKRAYYLYDAMGVVALVTPSPLPFAVPLIQVAAALAMGNAVILKPSELTPLSGLLIGELCMEAGFPAGIVNVIPGLPEEALRLIAHAKVDKAFLTGGVEAGRHVMAAAGCRLRPVVLCLGGKHPSVVAGDADVDRAARGVVWGALANCGQNCGSIERVYVEESIASDFLDRVLEEVDRVRIGNPLSGQVELGPMLTDERRREVHRQVSEAVDGGARLLRGGVLPDGPGYFYPPTVLIDPPPGCTLMREETLGPVIPIVVVDSIERAILLSSDGDYALTASGWTRSTEKAERLMAGLPAGVVTINDVLYSFGEPASTWSGYRMSGMGQNHGTPGLREMSRQRFVSFDGQPAQGPLHAFPYDQEAMDLAELSIEYLHAKRRFRRLRALGQLLRRRRFRTRVPWRSVLLAKKRSVK